MRKLGLESSWLSSTISMIEPSIIRIAKWILNINIAKIDLSTIN